MWIGLWCRRYDGRSKDEDVGRVHVEWSSLVEHFGHETERVRHISTKRSRAILP